MASAAQATDEKCLMSTQDDGTVIAVALEPKQCGNCGAMHYVFVNRDGETRCSACDLDYEKGKMASAHDQRVCLCGHERGEHEDLAGSCMHGTYYQIQECGCERFWGPGEN